MAFNKKFSPDRRGTRGAGPASRGQRTYSRGGYQAGGADNGDRRQGSFQSKAPQQRRFGPQSQRPEQPAREGEQRGRTDFRKPAYGKPAFDRREPQQGYRGRPQAPRTQDAQRSFGRPAPGQRPYGRPAPQPFTPVQAVEVQQPEGLPENLLSGRNPIREALKSGRDIERLLVASGELSGSAREIVAMARNAGIVVQVVERSRLDQITRNHQGMVAYASAYAYASVEDILAYAREKGEEPFLIVLDQITDPHNLGAIIRTAACVGAHGIIVQSHRAVGLTPSAVRASAGAVEHVKVAKVVNINNTIRSLKKQGIWFYAADSRGTDYRKVSFSKACALVIGSEGEGISQLTLSLCDAKVSIPMSGVIDSLNASVAAGILMYAAYAGRNA